MPNRSKQKTLVTLLVGIFLAIFSAGLAILITKWSRPSKVEVTNFDSLKIKPIILPAKSDTVFVPKQEDNLDKTTTNPPLNRENKELITTSTSDQEEQNAKNIPTHTRNNSESENTTEAKKINSSPENVVETPKKSKCEIENTGNYNFINETNLELRIILHLSYKDLECTIKPKQTKSFYDLIAGPLRYEVTNDEPPGTFHGYNTPGKPISERPPRYFDD